MHYAEVLNAELISDKIEELIQLKEGAVHAKYTPRSTVSVSVSEAVFV